MQKQISSWRKELSIIAETGTGSDNGKLNLLAPELFFLILAHPVYKM